MSGGSAGSEAGAGGAGAGAGGEGGSGEGGEAGSGLPSIEIRTPEELADESHADYADNEHGIITGDTLASWIGDWAARHPAAATGKLVVLQIVPSVAASLVRVAPSDGVVSHLVPQSELTPSWTRAAVRRRSVS